MFYQYVTKFVFLCSTDCIRWHWGFDAVHHHSYPCPCALITAWRPDEGIFQQHFIYNGLAERINNALNQTFSHLSPVLFSRTFSTLLEPKSASSLERRWGTDAALTLTKAGLTGTSPEGLALTVLVQTDKDSCPQDKQLHDFNMEADYWTGKGESEALVTSAFPESWRLNESSRVKAVLWACGKFPAWNSLPLNLLLY